VRAGTGVRVSTPAAVWLPREWERVCSRVGLQVVAAFRVLPAQGQDEIQAVPLERVV